jgi:class 3 adenylate cyclase
MREDLERVLAAYRDGEGDRGAEEARIWREYGREAAIFVLDLAGFTRGLADFGLLDYLDRVHRLLCLTDPIIAEHGGRTMKHDADNCYAAFETVAGAIAAAERCLDHLGRAGAGA